MDLLKGAVERSEALDMARLALTVDIKWGSYNPDGILFSRAAKLCRLQAVVMLPTICT
jgi:hypothetical protein